MVHLPLSTLPNSMEGADFQNVRLDFSGQTALLTGSVRSPAARQAADHFARTQVRVGPSWWNGSLNPIASVRNELQLAKPGFLLLTRLGNQGQLAGQTFNASEQEAVIAAAAPFLPDPKDTLLLTVAEERGEASNLEVTLNSLPAKFDPQSPTLLAATLGQNIEALDPNQSEAALQQLFETRGWDWGLCEPLILQMRTWISKAEDVKKRMALPLPHVLLLAAGTNVHLRGAVADQPTQTAFVEAARQHFRELSVTSDILVSDKRRPVTDLTSTLSSWPSAPDAKSPGLAAFAVPGEDWRVREIKPEEAFATIPLIPESFPADLARPDFDALASLHAAHLQSVAEMAEQEGWPQPFLLLLVSSNRIEVRGELPTHALKEAVIAAADKTYAPATVLENLRVNAGRRPVTLRQAAAILEKWPAPPAENSPGVMAFTLLASPWTEADVPPVQLRSEEIEDFARLKLLPPSVPLEDVKEDLAAFATAISEQSQRIHQMNISRLPGQPFLTLLALGRQVILRGDAGSPELKASVINAARAFYKDREVIDEIRVDTDPPQIIKPGFTVKTFPPAPAIDGPGLLGFSLPGQPWLQMPLTWDVPTREELENAGLFSKVFDPAQAWPDYESWLPKLEQRIKPPEPSTKSP